MAEEPAIPAVEPAELPPRGERSTRPPVARVRSQRIIYMPTEDSLVLGPGIDVAAEDDTLEVSAVGWEIRSSTGRAEVLIPSGSVHPQPSLPFPLSVHESARWMMTGEEILAAAPPVDPGSALLTPFAVVGDARVSAAGEHCLSDPASHPGSRPTATPSEHGGTQGPLHDLESWERKVSSQNGEDGVIDAIFATIGTTNTYFVEFGCGSGVECNAANPLLQGWTGLLMDGFHESKNPRAEIKNEFGTADNIQSLLTKYDVPEEFDLLSIDVDGNDFWIWEQITSRPRVVIVEYNAHVSPLLSRTIRYDPAFRWEGTDYFGASLLALSRLGRTKGYTLVHCERNGVNAFFVADECLPSGFRPRPIEAIYRPPNFWGLGFAYLRDPSRTMLDPFPSGGDEPTT